MRSAPEPWRCRSALTATRSRGLRRRPARRGAAPGAPPMCPTLPGASSRRTVPSATPGVATPRRRTKAGGECVWRLGCCRLALPRDHRRALSPQTFPRLLRCDKEGSGQLSLCMCHRTGACALTTPLVRKPGAGTEWSLAPWELCPRRL